MPAAKHKRFLPADVYDTLEFSALVYGGIGGGWSFEKGVPVCAIGHAVNAGITGLALGALAFNAGIEGSVNDGAVARVNARRGKPMYERVPFKAWAKELNVVRGS